MSDLLESLFPNLTAREYQITSPVSIEYNCIAWAAEDDTTWWWPDAFEEYYWPPQAPRTETIQAFVAAYSVLGYEPCLNADLEPGFEKIALYVDVQGIPTHAARQLPSGKWTSKLGQLEDIEHDTLASLCGQTYGKVGQILRRPVKTVDENAVDSES